MVMVMNMTNNDLSIAQIGDKVIKNSKKPFKSGNRINVVSGYGEHFVTGHVCYFFKEDGTYVEVNKCRIATEDDV